MASLIAGKLTEGVRINYIFPDGRGTLETNGFKKFYFSSLPNRTLEWRLLGESYSNFCLHLSENFGVSEAVIASGLRAFYSQNYFITNPITSFVYRETKKDFSDIRHGIAYVVFLEHSENDPLGKRSLNQLTGAQRDIVHAALKSVKTKRNEVKRYSGYRA